MIRVSKRQAPSRWRARDAARAFLPVPLVLCLVSIALATEGSRSISGTVTAESSGNTLDGVTVCVSHKSDLYSGWLCGVSDGAGFYQVTDIEARNDYVVWVDHTGTHAYFRELYDNKPCCVLEDGTDVDLTNNDVVIDFGLAVSGSISGFVGDSVTGDPIREVELRLYVEDCKFILASYTQDDGSYKITSVPDGTFYVYALGQPYGYINELYPDSKLVYFGPCAEKFAGAQALVIQDHTQLSGIDFELDQGATIQGRISSSNPDYSWLGSRARLHDSNDGRTLATTLSFQEDGSYEFLGLLPGSYHVVLTGQRYNEYTNTGLGLIDERYDSLACPRNSCPGNLGEVISVSGVQVVTGVDALLETGALIRGRVTDAGSGDGVTNFCVAIYNSIGKYAGFGCTDENGNYESTTGFPDGDYLLSNQFFVNAPRKVRRDYIPQVWKADGSFGACGDPCDFLQGDPITVGGLGPVEGIDLAMELGTGIAGQVLVNGQSLANAAVALLDGNSGQEITRVFTGDGVEFGLGDYLLEGLASGGYYLRTFNGQGFEDRLHGDPEDIACNPDCDPFEGKLIEVTPTSATLFFDFDLTQSARVSGAVIDPDANPVAGVRVEAYNALGDLAGSGFSNALGEFEIDGLGGGQFFVRTRDAFGFVDALYDGLSCPARCDVRDGTPVQLSDGEVLTGLELRLGLAAMIMGKVTGQQPDGSDIDLPGTVIEIFSEFGTLAAAPVTDLQGRYAVDGLAPGAYHVVTRNGARYIDKSANGALCSTSCDPLSTVPVILQSGQHKRIDFFLFFSSSLFVQVRHANGFGLHGITVAAFDVSGDEFTRGTTDPSGRMELFGFPAGDYFLRTFNDQGFVDQVYDGLPCTDSCDPLQGTRLTLDQLDSANAEFVLSGGFAISGRIQQAGTNPPEGIAGVTVLLLDGNFNLPLYTAMTSADGRYEFTGLPNGEYFLRTFGQHDFIDQVYGGEPCTPGRCRMVEGSVIDVSGADVSGIDLALQPGMEISGYAQDANETAIRDGWAVLFGASGEYLTVFSRLNEDGTFSLKGIAEGTYYLFLRSLNSQLVDTLYEGIPCSGYSCDTTSGTPIVLGGGNAITQGTGSIRLEKIRIIPNGVAVTVTANVGYELRGILKTENGTPVRSTRVYFFNEDGASVGEAITDGLGEFVSTAALPDGTYYAATSRAAQLEDEPEEAEDAENGVGEGLQDQAWSGFTCEGICAPSTASGFGTPIVVSGGDVDGIDFVLQRTPSVSIETFTNGVDADTPNGGEAPEIAPGDTVTWTYTVSNTGPERVSNIVVTDSQHGQAVECPKDSLAIDGSMDCTTSAPAEDLSDEPFEGVMGNCDGTPESRLYQTTGLVEGTSGGIDVTAEDFSHYCNPLDNKMLINSGLNDAWYYPPTAGQGFFITVWEDIGQMFLAWFTFDKDRPPGDQSANLGEPGHRWLTAQGKFADNRAVLDIISSSGGEFDKSTAVEHAVDGSLIVEFESCEKGVITYDIDSIDQQGVVPIQRIVADNVPACQERDGIAAHSQLAGQRPLTHSAEGFGINWGMNDAWYNPVTDGQGFLIVVFPEIEQVFMAWFTYETERPDGSAVSQLGEAGHRWITAFGPFSGNRAELDIAVSEGGRFDSSTATPTSREDGSIVLEFEDCKTGTISYDIPSIGRQGEVPIQRITLDMVSICEELTSAAQ